MMRPVALFFWLFAIALALPARASCPLSPDTINLITGYFKHSLGFVTDVDRAKLGRTLAFLQKGGSETIQQFERLANDLRGRAVTDVDGVANVRHLVLAIATAENELQAHNYIKSLDMFWNYRMLGIANSDPLSAGRRATANIRRVAGGSLEEMFELCAARWLVENGYQVEQFQRFGAKITIQRPLGPDSGLYIEADYELRVAGEILAADAKFTRTPGLDIGSANFSEDQLRKWARGLTDRDVDRVLVPTNGNPTPGALVRIAGIFAEENATEALARLHFAPVAIPGFN